MRMEHDGPPDPKPRGSSGYLPGGVKKAREETAAEFAKEMGWTFNPFEPRLASEPCGNFGVIHPPGPNARIAMETQLPPADAPLHEHLAFVGQVAVAMPEGVRLHDISRRYVGWDDCGWCVVFYAGSDIAAEAPDLSHAAMLAAIQAKRGAL